MKAKFIIFLCVAFIIILGVGIGAYYMFYDKENNSMKTGDGSVS